MPNSGAANAVRPEFAPASLVQTNLSGAADEEADLEGLAVDGGRLLLGLRGPLLRGRSALLEIDDEARGDQLRNH